MAELRPPFQQVGDSNTLRILRSEEREDVPTPMRPVFTSQSTKKPRAETENAQGELTFDLDANKHVETTAIIAQEGLPNEATTNPPTVDSDD